MNNHHDLEIQKAAHARKRRMEAIFHGRFVRDEHMPRTRNFSFSLLEKDKKRKKK